MIDVEKEVGNVVASLAMEGLICTENEKEIAAKLFRGEITETEAREYFDKEFDEKYGVKNEG